MDTGIDCSSDRYLAFRNTMFVFIFVYQAIPFLWYRLLGSRRLSLNPPVSKTDPSLAL